MTEEQQPTLDFEIDHPESFAQFLLGNPREILFYMNLLTKHHSVITAYLDDGRRFFLTAIVAIDEATGQFFLDPSNLDLDNANAVAARQITLLTHLDQVKIQLRLTTLRPATRQGRPVFAAALPTQLLRLQRREFFRLEPPVAMPIVCQVATTAPNRQTHTLNLTLSDISGGGACLITANDKAGLFPRDALFQHCRLDIPGEGVIQVNLRVRKVFEFSAHNGQSHLRIGCEFVNLPGGRLAFIERYIARIERERKART